MAHTGIVPLAVGVILEGAALVLMLARITTLTRAFRSARQRGADRASAFEAGLAAIGPPMAAIASWVRLEAEVWALFLFGWFLRPRVPAGAVAFTHHKDVGWSAIAVVLAMLLAVEGTLVDLGLRHTGYEAARWMALGIHVYGFAWVVADAQALRLYRTSLSAEQDGVGPILDLRIGFRSRAQFPISLVTAVTRGSWDTAGPEERLARVSGPANIKISFRHPVEVRAVLRPAAKVKALLLQVDDPEAFRRWLSR
jgi:hypothetical protein